jgi:hypothetical protein
MPRGFVTYAGHNSRHNAWILQTPDGATFSAERPQLRQPAGTTFRFGSSHSVYVPGRLRRDGTVMNAFDASNHSAAAGTIRRGTLTNADGSVRLKNDSTGMFARIPAHLSEYLGSANVIARPFENVHDDADGDHGTAGDTRDNFFEQVESMPSGLDFFAYCGHGSPDGLPSACISGPAARTRLATSLANLNAGGTVVLYACSTGAPGGFAQRLSVDLSGRNIAVWGHTQSGAASTNPTKVRYLRGEAFALQHHLSEAARARWNRGGLPQRIYIMAPFWTIDHLESQIAAAT